MTMAQMGSGSEHEELEVEARSSWGYLGLFPFCLLSDV